MSCGRTLKVIGKNRSYPLQMTLSLDNYKLRAALLKRGFEDITSEGRVTKSWKLHHPLMRHWVSIKLATDIKQPMATAPLVIHPDDARRLEAISGTNAGITLQPGHFGGGSTKYEGRVLGRAVSLTNSAAIDAFVSACTGTATKVAPDRSQPAEPSSRPIHSSNLQLDDIDPVLLSAAGLEVDADLAGQNVSATTRQQLIEARLGQGQFRSDMIQIWGRRCAVNGCGVVRALVASHAIAGRDNKDSAVRLDPYNGLLLTASIDRLFDQGLISFAIDGRLLRKPDLLLEDLAHLGMSAEARLRKVDKRLVGVNYLGRPPRPPRFLTPPTGAVPRTAAIRATACRRSQRLLSVSQCEFDR